MAENGWLTKSEVNSLYYNTVAGEISFMTEAAVGGHPFAIARLIEHQAADVGRRQVRILEIGANECGFARALINEIGIARANRRTEIERVDYLAVEYARPALEAVAIWGEEYGYFDRVVRGPAGQPTPLGEPPPKPAMVALAVIDDELNVNLGLVHAEANQFARSNTEPFDFIILNELLDDMPCRAFFADAAGKRYEAVPVARGGDEHWTMRVEARDPGGAALDGIVPGTITAHSPDWVDLVSGLAGSLRPGGMLLVHDYGFAEPFTALDKYASPQSMLPSFADVSYDELAGDDFPRSFFRVYGNEAKHVLQVTNDVNFADLASALEGTGTVFSVPHGSAKESSGTPVGKGDGLFLSEFGLLEPDDDLPMLLARLQHDQAFIRDDYAREYTGGRGNVFLDLVYVRA